MNDASREPFKRLFFALPCTATQRRAIAQWRSALGLRRVAGRCRRKTFI